MKKHEWKKICAGLVAIFVAVFSVTAQQASNAPAGGTTLIAPDDEDMPTSEFVTINVKDANISEVLKAYSLQTGQSIVVGPDVVSENVNVRLNNIPWEEALDVILKPYGFGYQVIGDTIVINKLENIVTVEGIEPLDSRVFKLSFLDAYDVQAIVEAQLSARGKFTILETKSLPGWEFGGQGSSGAATSAGIRERKQKQEIQKSKTFVVTDVPAMITKIENIIEEMDLMPDQVLIEAKFLEISSGGLSDIGLEYINAVESVNEATLTAGGTGGLQPSLVDDSMLKVLNMTTGFLDPLDARAAGGYGQDSGIRLSHSVLGDWGAEMLFAFMAQDDDANVLSAPRVLTLNNQEAAILVGQKYPIIESQNNSGSGSSITSTSLDYYENIGIQLNVIPQVCADNYVNMIVHPAVSEIAGFEAGVVTGGSDVQSGTQYPILKIREAETQIMLQSDSTAIIGGLQTERDKELIKKVPFLGDIPFIGRLFRRETITEEKIDLLIFIKASVIEESEYTAASAEAEGKRQGRMDLSILEDQAAEAEEAVAADVEPVAEDEQEEAPAEETAEVENEEILDLVKSMDGETNATVAAEAPVETNAAPVAVEESVEAVEADVAPVAVEEPVEAVETNASPVTVAE